MKETSRVGAVEEPEKDARLMLMAVGRLEMSLVTSPLMDVTRDICGPMWGVGELSKEILLTTVNQHGTHMQSEPLGI